MPLTLITGSASGIGAATAQALKAAGHQVIGVDRQEADIVGDLSTADGRAQIIRQALARCEGKLDGLVLCAGLGPHVEPESLIVSVNYFGAVELLDGLLPALRAGQNPSAVVISSVASLHITWDKNTLAAALEAGDEARAQALVTGAGPLGGNLAYTAAKNALTVAVRKRAVAWGPAGVRLNSVAPGAIETPLLQAGAQDERYAQAFKDFVAPISRRGEPSEIASAVRFLMSADASYVHGAQIVVDGGIDAAWRPTQF